MSKLGAQQDPWHVNGSARVPTPLPDVAKSAAPQVGGTLDRVGMSGVDVALRRHDEQGHLVLTPAKADVFVSLDDPQAKGIHMSRLFLALHEQLDQEELSPGLMDRLLHSFVGSHEGLSNSASLRLEYVHLRQRPALLSDHSAWRSYPVAIHSVLSEGKVRHQLTVRVTYSSTCPCSAALAKALLKEQLESRFAGEGELSLEQVVAWLESEETMYPTPHSQRSHADVTVVLDSAPLSFPVNDLVDRVEGCLATAVQAVVKRQDEQEFARVNGVNLMFCEDSARRIRASIEEIDYVCDFHIRVEHLESLHPHDAVAVVTKGLPAGLQP